MSRKEQIVDVARQLLEADGPGGVTMRAIADRLEIRAPSLYKHIADKHELEVALIARGFAEQAEAFTAAISNTTEPVAAIAHSYRSWALANPHLYALMTSNPLPRNDLPAGLEIAAAAPLVEAVHGNTDRARALWAFAHGMVSLELAKRFPPDADLDTAWATGLRSLAS
ncbi:MAG: TetR/AcrR family transcriptional regulator [Acidimicrobiia bacterium]|nr:TetR/AcrR family transcriptional regulator [Acidimicrobiia bacterium]